MLRFLRLIALATGGFLLVVAAVLVSFVVSGYNLVHEAASDPVPALVVAPDPSLLARGAHLGRVLCADCHAPRGDSLPAGGDRDFLHRRGGPDLGSLHAPNLTPSGRLRRYSDGELSRAIRGGLDRDDRPLLVMPSQQYHEMSDRDLAAIITWLRAQPPAGGDVAPRRLTWKACLLIGMHALETSHTIPLPGPKPALPEGMTAEYGAYMTGILGCASCHGASLRGGHPGPVAPDGPDLLAFVSAHDLSTFDAALRRGISPRGSRSMDPELMPWPAYAHLSDTESAAIYASLQRLAKR